MLSFFKKKKSIPEDIKIVYEEDYNDIQPLAEYFKNETGITFNKQISILKSRVTSFCKRREIHSFSQLLKDIQIQTKLKQELIDYLTTNETFFYREFNQIKELVKLVRESHQKVSIICAPSATGEEPYSIAIALLEDGISASNFTIMGIDINQDATLKAINGVYRERNTRNLTSSIISKYFTIENDNYMLHQNVKTLVTFKVCNIFDDSFKNIGKFDFVFSRNMLIYFNQETKIKAKKILENLRKNNNHDIFLGHADLF